MNSYLKNNYIWGGISFLPVFCAEEYRDLNRQVSFDGLSNEEIFKHFISYGMPNGLCGSKKFDPKAYAYNWPDLRKTWGENWTLYYWHYLQIGLREGRSGRYDCYLGENYRPVFDLEYYRKKNPDLQDAFGDDNARYIEHFVRFGMEEARSSSLWFSVFAYKWRFDRCAKKELPSMRNYFQAYLLGQNAISGENSVVENRDLSPVYSYLFYRSHNGDVNELYGDDSDACLRHFLHYGMKEGRVANAQFNVRKYRLEHPELRKKYGMDFPSYYIHYLDAVPARNIND